MSPAGVTESVVVAGSGPPLVLLHGGPGVSDYMGLLSDETTGWRTVRYQQRGLPPSTIEGPFTVDRHVEDLRAVIDATGSDGAVLLGHSWGTHLALQATLAMGERISGLVLVDPFGIADDGGAVALAQELNERILPEDRARAAEVDEALGAGTATAEDATAYLGVRWPGYFADPAAAPALPSGFAVSLACNGETMGSVFAALADGFAERLSGVRAPVEVLTGELSPLPPAAGEQLARHLPEARLTLVPGAGHLPWHERPGCVREALARIGERAG